MFTLICNRMKARRFVHRVFFVIFALLLAGCVGEPTGGAGALGFLAVTPPVKSAKPAALQKVPLFRGRVVVAGPKGYCIDPDSLRRRSGGSFVLLASCESLTGKSGPDVAPAVMTVLVLPRGNNAEPPRAADLAASMAPAKPIEIIDGDDGVSLVYLSSGGDAILPGGDPKYWRAGMAINGHIIGLAVYGLKGSAVSGKDGKRLIMGLAGSLRENSPRRDIPSPEAATGPAATTKPKGILGLKTLLGGLFPNPD